MAKRARGKNATACAPVQPQICLRQQQVRRHDVQVPFAVHFDGKPQRLQCRRNGFAVLTVHQEPGRLVAGEFHQRLVRRRHRALPPRTVFFAPDFVGGRPQRHQQRTNFVVDAL